MSEFKLKIRGVNTKNLCTFCAAVLAAAVGLFLFARALPYISPALVALVISMVLEPLIKQLIKRIRIKRAFAGTAVIVLVLALVFAMLWAILLKLAKEFSGLIVSLPDLLQGLYDDVTSLSASAGDLYSWLPFKLDFDISEIAARFIDWALVQAQDIAQGFVKNAVSTAATLPGGLMFVLTMMLSTYFLIVHRDQYIDFFKRNFPQKWHESIASAKNYMFFALIGYVKAQLIIMTILFVILLAGFLLLGVKYSYVIAFIVALFDALPVLGSSMILLPWAAYMLLNGNYFLGMALIALFLICSGARRLIEPKIISSSIGANPLLTVMAMYAGLKAIGLSGLILGPILYILARAFIIGLMGGKTFMEYFLIESELSGGAKAGVSAEAGTDAGPGDGAGGAGDGDAGAKAGVSAEVGTGAGPGDSGGGADAEAGVSGGGAGEAKDGDAGAAAGGKAAGEGKAAD
jgi:sporulation integral membrane protein YtvI